MLRTSYVIDSVTADFLESGCALITATVDADGWPHASRAWGLDVVDAAGARLQLLLDASDVRSQENLEVTKVIAVTAAHVPTLHSMQLKCHATGQRGANPTDEARADRFCEQFFTDIEQTEGTNRELLERLRPSEYVVFELVVDEIYDQTPGPGAGAAITPP
jgi:hypothetical protein